MRDGLRHFHILAEHVGAVERRLIGQLRSRLAQNAADHLRQRRLRCTAAEHGQHIGERAVPAFAKRVLGDDGAHAAIFREQIVFFQFLDFGGLPPHGIRLKPCRLCQVFVHIFGMHQFAGLLALVLAGQVHAHEHDRPDIAAGVLAQAPRVLRQLVQLIQRVLQHLLPRPLLLRDQPDRELDHFLVAQRQPGHVDENIRELALRCGRQFEDEARIESGKCASRLCGVGVMAFVQNDDGPHDAQHIAEAVLDPARRIAQVCCIRKVRDLKIGHAIEKGSRSRQIVRREEGSEACWSC